MEIQASIEVATVSNEEEHDEETNQEPIVFPTVIIVSDQLFTVSGRFKFLQHKQVGNAPGHYWKITQPPNARLSATATQLDDKAIFRIYTLFYRPRGKTEDIELNIVESVSYPRKVVAFDKHKDEVIVKELSQPPIQFRRISDVLATNPEILLVKHAYGRDHAVYQFYTTGSNYYGLGFGRNGRPLTPSTVTLNQAESVFRIIEPKQ